MDRKRVTLHTDGACSGNPGPGGYAAVLNCDGHEKTVTGHEDATTNNRMELRAVIEGLRALKVGCEVEVLSDSKYVTDAFNQKWLDGWVARGWRKTDKKPVENQNLWEALIAVKAAHTVTFTWVKGHAGHGGNETVDRLAANARSKRK